MKAYINMWIKLRHFEICTVYRDLSTIVYNLRLKKYMLTFCAKIGVIGGLPITILAFRCKKRNPAVLHRRYIGDISAYWGILFAAKLPPKQVDERKQPLWKNRAVLSNRTPEN